MPCLPFADRGHRVAVATLHGKAEALAPALVPLGLALEPVAIDTDALGTFAGDVERPGTAREVVIEKARRGMAASGLALGIATEGSFGPDPVLGFLPLHTELLAFIDDVHGQVIMLEHAGHDTNWISKALRPGPELAAALVPLLVQIGAPSHAAVLKPNAWLGNAAGTALGAMPVAKGLRESIEVIAAVEAMAAASSDGLVRVEADLRAHMNPTRMRIIARLGERLRDRLAQPCPACGAPGFGPIASEPGLPCELCNTPTDLVRAEVHGCGACGHALTRPRADGRTHADAGQCPECNP